MARAREQGLRVAIEQTRRNEKRGARLPRSWPSRLGRKKLTETIQDGRPMAGLSPGTLAGA